MQNMLFIHVPFPFCNLLPLRAFSFFVFFIFPLNPGLHFYAQVDHLFGLKAHSSLFTISSPAALVSFVLLPCLTLGFDDPNLGNLSFTIFNPKTQNCQSISLPRPPHRNGVREQTGSRSNKSRKQQHSNKRVPCRILPGASCAIREPTK